MIPRGQILRWQANAPWQTQAMVEQDLLLSRTLIEIYSDEYLSDALAFRGGTALHKLHLPEPRRYSEDLDFVQVRGEPIGEVMNRIRARLDPWLGTPTYRQGRNLIRFKYRYQSSDSEPIPMRLKIEINSRDHPEMHEPQMKDYVVDTEWFRGRAEIHTYQVAEILGSKLRALYGRKKGRDLFDLELGLALTEPEDILARFSAEPGKPITRALFEENLYHKMSDPTFLSDLAPLIPAEQGWDINSAAEIIGERLISKLPGKPWAGLPQEDDTDEDQ